jgi:general nucleoside transport system ATP-binding protein
VSGSIDEPHSTTPVPLLDVVGVTHDYGTLRALDDVSLDVAPGEVHALVGENGAGKSTLVKVVAGLLDPTAGSVSADGRAVPLGRTAESVAAGIGVVHQHFSLIESLTATENFLLGRPGSPKVLPLSTARREIAEFGERVGLDVDPDALVADLSIGQRQRLEILTALGWGARMVLLDEPSAVLSPTEADALLDDLKRLCAQGYGFLLITHKLREVEEFADRVTVLRGGRVVGRHTGRVDRDTLVEEMVGAEGRRPEAPAPRDPGPLRVEVRGVASGRLADVDLDLFGGIVVGVAGVVGSGQADLADVLAGARAPDTGTVRLDGTQISGDPVAAWSNGVAVIPEDRERDALALELPVWCNSIAKQHGAIGPWHRVDRAKVSEICDRVIDRLRVKPARHDIAAGGLSGGNQQRLVIGRELDRQPSLVVASEPTRGLDPPSALAVIDGLRSAAAAGAVVVVVASDLDELLELADRLIVVCAGRITMDTDAATPTRQEIGRAMVAVTAA